MKKCWFLILENGFQKDSLKFGVYKDVSEISFHVVGRATNKNRF